MTLCQEQTALKMFRGDSVSFPIATDTNHDLTTASSILFTAKNTAHDTDDAAIVQKALGTGIAVVDATNLTLDIVPQDTADISTVYSALVWDVQIQEAGGAVRTVASGTLQVELDVTQQTATSIPVYTSQPPVPGSGSATAFVHTQSVAADAWIINHNLGYFPHVTVLNSSNNEIEAEVSNTSVNQVVVSFSAPQTGQARLS